MLMENFWRHALTLLSPSFATVTCSMLVLSWAFGGPGWLLWALVMMLLFFTVVELACLYERHREAIVDPDVRRRLRVEEAIREMPCKMDVVADAFDYLAWCMSSTTAKVNELAVVMTADRLAAVNEAVRGANTERRKLHHNSHGRNGTTARITATEARISNPTIPKKRLKRSWKTLNTKWPGLVRFARGMDGKRKNR